MSSLHVCVFVTCVRWKESDDAHLIASPCECETTSWCGWDHLFQSQSVRKRLRVRNCVGMRQRPWQNSKYHDLRAWYQWHASGCDRALDAYLDESFWWIAKCDRSQYFGIHQDSLFWGLKALENRNHTLKCKNVTESDWMRLQHTRWWCADICCRNAIELNAIPCITSLVPGGYDNLKLDVTLGVPHAFQHLVCVEEIMKVFPYGEPCVKIQVGPCHGTSACDCDNTEMPHNPVCKLPKSSCLSFRRVWVLSLSPASRVWEVCSCECVFVCFWICLHKCLHGPVCKYFHWSFCACVHTYLFGGGHTDVYAILRVSLPLFCECLSEVSGKVFVSVIVQVSIQMRLYEFTDVSWLASFKGVWNLLHRILPGLC